MNFSQAFEAVKNGKAIQRDGWNGNGLQVMAQFPDEHSKMGNPYLYIDARALGGERNPWVPSQTDLFAEDWREVTPLDDATTSTQEFQDKYKQSDEESKPVV